MVIVLVATDMSPPHGGVVDPLLRLASESGAAGVHLGAGCLLAEIAPVAAALLGAGLAVPSLTLPVPERRPAAGKRMPYLAAIDPDERAAALALAGAGMAAGAAVGLGHFVLDFGPVTLPVAREEVASYFARRELDEGEPGADRLALALEARRAWAPRLLDACRWALERACREADGRGATLLLRASGTPWGVPSPRETLDLLAGFRGAPLALLWDPGQLTVLRALGLPLSGERLAALAQAAGGALEHDAVGLDAGYLPGLGERDEGLPAAPKLGVRAPVIITGGADVTAAEVTEAVRAVTARYS